MALCLTLCAFFLLQFVLRSLITKNLLSKKPFCLAHHFCSWVGSFVAHWKFVVSSQRLLFLTALTCNAVLPNQTWIGPWDCLAEPLCRPQVPIMAMAAPRRGVGEAGRPHRFVQRQHIHIIIQFKFMKSISNPWILAVHYNTTLFPHSRIILSHSFKKYYSVLLNVFMLVLCWQCAFIIITFFSRFCEAWLISQWQSFSKCILSK